MFSSIFWLIPLALEALLLLRAFQAHLLRYFPYFYSYLALVALRDLSLLTINSLWPKTYPYAYWGSELLMVVVGCGVVWEAYKVALSRFPGAARMARSLLAFIFIFTFSRVFVMAWDSGKWIPGSTTLETERELRFVQLALLLGLVALFSYYRIPLGRNLKGIVYGFMLFVSATVIHLTFGAYLGREFQYLWPYVQPITYFLVLLLWSLTLWSYHPLPSLASDSQLVLDYLSLSSNTRRQIKAARSLLYNKVRRS